MTLSFIYKMKKYTIKIGNIVYNFGIKNYKLLLGDNEDLKQDLIYSIIKEFNKGSNSEYSIDEKREKQFLINDNNVNLRNTSLYLINSRYDYEDEYKLKARSLILKFLRTVFEDIDYNDTLNTINILLEQLSDELTEELSEFNSTFEHGIEIEKINFKNIFKLMDIKMKKDNKYINMYDLKYEDNILSQLSFIKTIAEKSFDKDHIVILELPILTKKIFDFIKTIQLENLDIIVSTTKYNIVLKNINNIIYVNKQFIDFRDEVAIYNDLIMNLNEIQTLETIEEEVLTYLNDKEQIDNKIGEIL